jgi:hypothetical protein
VICYLYIAWYGYAGRARAEVSTQSNMSAGTVAAPSA